MRTRIFTSGRLFTCLALALGVFLCAQAALADRLILKDGRELEGTVVREEKSAVLFRITAGSINNEKWYARSDIEEIVKGDDTGSEEAGDTPRLKERDEGDPLPENATRIAFITTGDGETGRDMVGTYLSADAIRRSIEVLDDLPESRKPDILVLEVDSGGGYVAEYPKLIQLIHHELKRDYRVVAWIESAISAAAMTSFMCDEIVMTPQGNLGGATTLRGSQSVRGPDLERFLADAEEVLKLGRRNPHLIRSMKLPYDLSADKDEYGNVTFYPNLQGEHILCTAEDTPGVDHVLTLNSVEAEFFNISTGTAGSKDELARVLGVREWVEVGREAEEAMQDFLSDMKENETKLGQRYREFLRALALAEGAGNEDDLRFYVGKAEYRLKRIERMVEESPPLRFIHGLDEEWFELHREILEELRDRA